jgi:ABC-type lipoprotein export system ATPase subunit
VTAIVARDLFRVHATAESSCAALQGLNLDVADGESVVVLGPSGSGKSTLLRILAGLERPSAGSIHVLGQDLSRLDGRPLARFRATQLGYVEQHYTRALDPDLTARDLVGLQLGLAGASGAERARRADELLERVGLLDRRDARPGELSGGEQQRVAVCAALAHRPRLLLADEPTGELDAANAASLYDLLGELTTDQGCTSVIVSHDLGATALADRVVRVRDGRVSTEAGAAGDEAIVVGRGGWVQLPEELLARAGIHTRLRARLAGTSIVLDAAGESGARQPATPAGAAPVTTPSPANGGPPAARVRGLTKTYRSRGGETTALQTLDADIRPGVLTAVTGRSGSGKTTLLLVLAGLEAPTTGEVEVCGLGLGTLDRAARARLRRDRVAFVSQQLDLVPTLSARENVEVVLTLRGVGHAEAESRAAEALEQVGLGPRAEQRAARLSAGERQRVSLARAMASRPALLLADEPTAHLDESAAVAAGAFLERLAAVHGTAVVCATHDPVLIERAGAEIALDRRSLLPSEHPDAQAQPREP